MNLNKEYYKDYMDAFLKQNSMLNLISKNDEKYLWEKHTFDSLAIRLFFEKYLPDTEGVELLDIGTGGGFPAVPAAIAFPRAQVWAIDSIRKKINAIENLKAELGLENLHPICARVETLNQKFDVITSRAVAPLKVIAEYAAPCLKDGGYFVAYKSKRADEEIADAESTLNRLKLKIVEVIDYELPLEENYSRKLIIVKK